jgi:iron complex outermembrane receptor protein
MTRASVLLAIVAAALPARAQQVELPAVLETPEINLDQVVVLAAKRPQPLREAAASSSIITAADLQAFGWRDFTEAIASLAGFYTSDARDNTNFGVRGIGLRGDTNGRILILVDGHTQQELWAHSAYPEQIGLDASMIDHLEVLRGPASALYGSLGFLAIINVVTRRGNARDWAQVTYEMQDARAFRGAASFGHLWKNGLELGISLQAKRELGYSYDYPDLAAQAIASPCSMIQMMEFPKSCISRSDPETDASTSFSMFAHLDYKGFSIKGSYQYFDKNIPFQPYLTIFNEKNRYLLQRGYVDASYEVGRPSLALGVLRAYYDYAGYADDLTYSSDMTQAGRYIFHDQADPYWIGGDAKLFLERDWKDILHFSFTAGGEFTYFHGNDISGPVGMSNPEIQKDILFGAVYGQVELTYLRKIFLTLGARGDFASVYPSAVSPRVGLVFLPHKHTTVKLLYSHGFIHPSWYYSFFDDGVSIAANPNLQPERADNYELVVQQEAAGLVLTGSLFYIHGSDIIEQHTICVPETAAAPHTDDCPAGQADRAQRFNGASFQSYGAELGVSGKLKHDIRLYANYGWAHATDESGGRAFNSPEHLFKLGVSVPLWRDHLHAGAELKVISPRLLDPGGTDETPTATILNAHVTWRDLPKGLSATLKVYNLTAQTYYEPSSAETSFPIARIPHAGPTVLLRLTYAH